MTCGSRMKCFDNKVFNWDNTGEISEGEYIAFMYDCEQLGLLWEGKNGEV